MRGPPAWATLAAASAPMAAPSWRMASPVPCTFGVEQVLPSSQMVEPAWCITSQRMHSSVKHSLQDIILASRGWRSLHGDWMF